MNENDDKRKPGTSRFVLTEPVVMLMPTVVTPRKFQENGKPKGDPMYTAQFKFNPDGADLKAMKALCAKLANEKWPGRLAAEAAFRKNGTPLPAQYLDSSGNPRLLSFPFKLGDKLADEAKAKKKDREYFRGGVVISAKSDEAHPPKLSGFENGKAVSYTDETKKAAAGKFYNGVEVLAQFNLVAYESPQLHGITVYLNGVFTTNKGTKYASGSENPAEVYGEYLGKVSQEDPTGAQFVDDEIPF